MLKRRVGIGVFWFLLSSLLTGEQSLGQQAFVTVLDQKSGEPVAYAHVCYEGLVSGSPVYCMTSMEGKALNGIRERSRIAVSFVGYTTLYDTIMPGESRQLLLVPTVLTMDEVVVTAQYAPERADKSIYKVGVINSRQIELKGATNMADLLKDQVSMNVSQDGVLGTSLSIQGLSGENVKFLMDGIPLIGRMNGNFDLNQINLNNVDHIEIIEGPMSVIYGSNALAGVVNVITREHRSSAVSATANAYFESVGMWNADGTLSGRVKRHAMGISGGRNFFGGYSPRSDTGRSQLFKPRRQYFVDGYYAYSRDGLKIKVAGDYFNEMLQDKGNLQPPYFEQAFDAWFTTRRYTGRLDVNWHLWDAHALNLVASYSAYSRVKETFLKNLVTLEQTPTQDPEQQDTTTLYACMGRITFARNNDGKRFNYQLGLDLNYESGFGKRILDGGQGIGDYAAFLSVKWDPVKPLTIQPGVRFIYNTKYQAPVVYAISGKWEVLDPLILRISFSRGFRAPSIKELYLFFKDVNHDIQGNPELKAETSHNLSLHLEFAVEKRKRAFSAEISGFYNAVQHIITLARMTEAVNNLSYSYVNLDRYKTAGGQVTATVALYPSLRISAGVAGTGIRVEMSDGAGTPGFTFFTDVNTSVSYRFVKPEITLALLYKYTGRRQQPYLDGDTLSLGYVDPYHTLDLTLAKGFWRNRIRVATGVKNLFNNQVIPSTGLGGGGHGAPGQDGVAVGYGRTLFIRLSFNLNLYQ